MQIKVPTDSTLIAFNDLINTYSKIYDLSVLKLTDLEEKGMVNSKEYRKTIKKIRQLKNYDEKRILEKLDGYDFDSAYEYIYSKLNDVCAGDIEKLEALQARIEYFSSEKEWLEEMEDNFYDTLDDYLDGDDEEDEDEVNIDDTYDTSTPVKIEFLKYLENLDFDKLAFSYVIENNLRQTIIDMMDVNDKLALLEELGARVDDKEYNKWLKLINYTNDLDILKNMNLKKGNPTYDATLRAIETLKEDINIDYQKEVLKNNLKKQALKYKYLVSFTHPKLEEELLLVNYNPNNLRFLSDKAEAEMNDISEETYTDEDLMAWFNYAEDSFQNLFNLASDPYATKSEIAIAYEEVKFAILDQNTEYIADFYRQYFNNPDINITKQATEFILRLNEDLIEEMTSREDFDDDLLLNDSEFSQIKLALGENQLENLFGLLDSIKDINNTLKMLWQYEQYSLKDSKEFKEEIKKLNKLCNDERDYKNNLNIDFRNPDIAYMVLNNISEYFKSINELNESKINIGKERNSDFLIKHAVHYIFGTKTLDNSTFKDDSVPHYIIKNYELECLSNFEDKITEENKLTYLETKYEKILEDAYLTEEFAITEGNIKKAIILNDDDVSKLLEIERDEYEYNKDCLIKDHVKELITLFSFIPDNYSKEDINLSSLDYSLVSFEVALSHLNKDSLEEIKEFYNKNNNKNRSNIYKNLQKKLTK